MLLDESRRQQAAENHDDPGKGDRDVARQIPLAEVGEEFMLPSFLGPILGGTLLAGGYVSVVGTLLGTTLTTVIRKGLDLLGVGLESLNIYLGLILLVALSTDRIRTKLSDRQEVRKR